MNVWHLGCCRSSLPCERWEDLPAPEWNIASFVPSTADQASGCQPVFFSWRTLFSKKKCVLPPFCQALKPHWRRSEHLRCVRQSVTDSDRPLGHLYWKMFSKKTQMLGFSCLLCIQVNRRVCLCTHFFSSWWTLSSRTLLESAALQAFKQKGLLREELPPLCSL